MAGTTVETKIAYKLDARGLREARKELEKTFKASSTKELNAALKEMRGIIKTVTSEQIRLTSAMLGVEKGTDEYKKLAKELQGVEKQLGLVQRAAHAAAGAVRDAGHGAFSQGMLQGIAPGAAGFLQRGPGMRRQFAGQMVGHGMRSGFGRAMGATSAMVGGAGPFGTLLGNVPFVGGAAQLAEQSAGMAVDYQRARLQAMPFMGMTPEGLAGMRAGVNARMPRMSAADIQRRAAEIAAPQLASRLGGGGRGGPTDVRGGAGAGGGRDRARDLAGRQSFSYFDPTSLGAFGQFSDSMGGFQESQSAGAGAARIRDSALAQAQREADEQRARRGSISGAVNRAFDPYMRAGRRAVYTRQETMGAIGEMGGAIGRAPGAGEFQSALGLERLYGVDKGTSAQLLRQQRPGRGGSTGLGEDMLASLVADAVGSGLEGSEITEHLAHIADLQEQAASHGLKVQSESLSQMARGLSGALGLEGTRAGAVAGQFAGAAQGVVTQGARSPMDIQMLRAAGYSPEGGQKSFLSARRKLANIGEGGFDAGTMFDVLKNVVGGSGDEEEAGYVLEKALGSMGVQVGTEEAIKMARGVAGGREAFAATVEQAGGIRTAEGVGKALDSADFKALTATMRAQNAVQDKLLSAGQDVVGNVQRMQLVAAGLADKIGDLAPMMGKVVSGVETVGNGLEMLIDKINEWNANGPRQP